MIESWLLAVTSPLKRCDLRPINYTRFVKLKRCSKSSGRDFPQVLFKTVDCSRWKEWKHYSFQLPYTSTRPGFSSWGWASSARRRHRTAHAHVATMVCDGTGEGWVDPLCQTSTASRCALDWNSPSTPGTCDQALATDPNRWPRWSLGAKRFLSGTDELSFEVLLQSICMYRSKSNVHVSPNHHIVQPFPYYPIGKRNGYSKVDQ